MAAIKAMQRYHTKTDRQLRTLMQRARENERKMHKFHALELRLIEADTFPKLFAQLLGYTGKGFPLDSATLALADPDHEIRRMVEEHLDKPLFPDDDHSRPEQERAEHIKYLNLITERSDRQKLDELGSDPTLCAYNDEKHRWLFPDVSPNPRSIAVLPLARRGRVMGSLNLGSQDPYRFANGARTDFLSRLAAVAGICIENTLNFHRLRTAGMTDALTGIKNRRFFNERMLEEVSRAHRNQQPLTFLLVDIDRFKDINDTHGHLTGDRILHDVAQRIARALRLTDVLTRYGGEEFAAILPDTDTEVGYQVAERIRAEVSDEMFYLANGEALSATISIGAAVIDEEQPGKDLEEQVHELTKQADRALLDAKEGGRNRVVCASRRLDA